MPGLQAIRKLISTYVGQRVLVTDAGVATSKPSKPPSNELVLERTVLKPSSSGSLAPDAISDLRNALDQSQALLRTANPIFAIEGPANTNPDPNHARVIAAATLLNRSAALIVAGQELGIATDAGIRSTLVPWGHPAPSPTEAPTEPTKPPAPVVSDPHKYQAYVPYVPPPAPKKPIPPDPATVAGQEAIPGSLLNFYRQLSVLHHGGTAIGGIGTRDAEEITLSHDDLSALIVVRKPASPSLADPAVVIACNLSDKPLVLSLRPDMMRFKLRGNFLRTLLRSDDGMGGNSIDPMTVPPYGVYVGELRY